MIRKLIFIFLLILPFQQFSQTSEDTLLVGYTSAPPFIIEQNDELQGISVWLWKRCAKELRLNYQFVQLPFRDMLDSLGSGGIDVGINPLTITSQRLEKMDFTLPFYTSYSVVAKGKLTAFQRARNFFKSFFSLAFLSGFLILMFLIGLFGFLAWHFEQKVNPQHFRKGIKGVWDGLWWSVVTMTTVGYGDKAPKSTGGKVVALLWMFTGLLFISGLTASVASSLTVDRINITSEEFKNYKNRPIGTVNHSSSEEYLKDNFFRNVSTYSSVVEGLDAILENEIEAFVYDDPILRYRLSNDSKYSDLRVMQTKFRAEMYAFGVALKNQSLRDLLSHKIIDVTERSEWQKVLKEYRGGDELE